MYPSLIVAHGLCYTPTGAVLPGLMRALIAERLELQRLAARADARGARRLEARQRAVKLAMNCVFGMAACAEGPLPCRRLAAQVTAAGREALARAAAALAAAATVVYGDSVAEDTAVRVYDCTGAPRVCTVAELFEAYEREPSAPPVLTRTLLGVAPVRAVLRRESTKPMFRVTLASGAHVDVTADHSLVRRDGTLVSPRDLAVGTRLATAAC
jgi:hypothetical protein